MRVKLINTANSMRLRDDALTWVLLLSIYLLGQFLASILLSLPWGPALGGDSSRYLDGVIEEGTVPYAGYIALVWLAGLFGSPSVVIVIFQSFLAIVAARALLSVGTQLNSAAAGWISACWFLLFIEVVQWTRYILTESIFFSVTLILVFVAISPWKSEKYRIFFLIGISILGSTLRPNGFILIGAVVTFMLIKYQSKVRAIVGTTVTWSFLALSQVTIPWLSTGDTGSFEMRFLKGEVFWNQTDFQRVMPSSNGEIQSTTELLLYILQHPIDSIALIFSRLGWELIQVRPWYSDFHNLYIIVFMIIFYVAAFVGWKKVRHSSLNLFVWCLTIPSMALIGATWAIYEGRFAWWFLVAWMPWVGIGLKTIFDWGTSYFKGTNKREADVPTGS